MRCAAWAYRSEIYHIEAAVIERRTPTYNTDFDICSRAAGSVACVFNVVDEAPWFWRAPDQPPLFMDFYREAPIVRVKHALSVFSEHTLAT